MKTKRLTQYALLTALALIFSYLEAQIPAFFTVPGIKLGLTNLVVILALYCMDEKSALIINIIRILLVGILFGNLMSLAYSLAGGILSGITMLLLYRTRKFRTITVSIAGGVMHNVGQIVTAMILLETRALIWYLPVLWFSGIAAGAVIGFIGALVCDRLSPLLKKQ